MNNIMSSSNELSPLETGLDLLLAFMEEFGLLESHSS